MRYMRKHWLVLILWLLFLFSVLLSPVAWWRAIPGPWGVNNSDKLSHIGLFAVTGFVIVFGTSFLLRLRNRMLLALMAGVVLAGGTEIAQHFIPRRTMDIYDFLTDLAGLGVGLLVYYLLYRRRIVH